MTTIERQKQDDRRDRYNLYMETPIAQIYLKMILMPIQCRQQVFLGKRQKPTQNPNSWDQGEDYGHIFEEEKTKPWQDHQIRTATTGQTLGV